MMSITLTKDPFHCRLKETRHQVLMATMYQPIDIPLCA